MFDQILKTQLTLNQLDNIGIESIYQFMDCIYYKAIQYTSTKNYPPE